MLVDARQHQVENFHLALGQAVGEDRDIFAVAQVLGIRALEQQFAEEDAGTVAEGDLLVQQIVVEALEGVGRHCAGRVFALATVGLHRHMAGQPAADLWLLAQSLAESGQHAGRQFVVGVQQQYVAPLGQLHAVVARGGGAGVGLANALEGGAETLAQGAEHRRGVVAGAIVDHPEFDLRGGLGQHRLDGTREHARVVVGGDDDAKQRLSRHCHTSPCLP
ncbi:hypothetical protein D9M71_628740 [compost metagenome]